MLFLAWATGYLVVGAVVAGVACGVNEGTKQPKLSDDDEVKVFLVAWLLWPLTLMLLIAWFVSNRTRAYLEAKPPVEDAWKREGIDADV